jgi:hypothetical protein
MTDTSMSFICRTYLNRAAILLDSELAHRAASVRMKPLVDAVVMKSMETRKSFSNVAFVEILQAHGAFAGDTWQVNRTICLGSDFGCRKCGNEASGSAQVLTTISVHGE